MAIITLAEYKLAKGITSGDTTKDARITFIIDAVSELIQAYIKADFTGGESITETIPVDYETNTIYLQRYPLSTVLSVTELSTYTTDSTVHVPLTGTADFTIDLTNGVLTRVVNGVGFGRWPYPGSVVVSYITAPTWSSVTIPFDLKLATVYLVDYYLAEEYRQSKSAQGSSLVNIIASGTDFPKHIQVILDRYL